MKLPTAVFTWVGSLVITLSIIGPAQATLIGDQVFALTTFPTLGGPPFSGGSTNIVVEGDSDLIFLSAQTLQINVEAEEILIDFLKPVAYSCDPACDFNGIVVHDLDWVGALEGKITQVITESNLVGFTDERVIFGNDFVAFNFNNLSCPLGACSGVFVNAKLVTEHVPIPEPSTMLLFATGLAGLAAWRWKRAIQV